MRRAWELGHRPKHTTINGRIAPMKKIRVQNKSTQVIDWPGGSLAPAETAEIEMSAQEIDILLEAGLLVEVEDEKPKKGAS